MTGNGSAFEFPCDVPVKVFGHNGDAFRSAVFEIVRIQFPGFRDAASRERVSSGDRFLSITLNLWIEEQAQLEALYTALTAHEDILMVL